MILGMGLLEVGAFEKQLLIFQISVTHTIYTNTFHKTNTNIFVSDMRTSIILKTFLLKVP